MKASKRIVGLRGGCSIKCDLTKEETRKLANLLIEYKSIWDNPQKDKPKIQHTTAVKCEIETTCERPIQSKAYKTTPVEDFIIQKHIKAMEERGVI